MIIFLAQSKVPEYIGDCPDTALGIVWSLTLIVSNGCPADTKHIPPKPPAKKFLAGDVFCPDIYIDFNLLFLNQFI
jgi:hypothetical protein